MTKNYLLKKVDDELWRKIKIYTVKRGITIKGLIIGLLEKQIKDETDV